MAGLPSALDGRCSTMRAALSRAHREAITACRTRDGVVKLALLTPRNSARSMVYRADRRRTRAPINTAEKTAGNVEQLATTGTTFLSDFDMARRKALKEARQEWTRIRRWTVPALAIALVLAAPLFVVAGAVGQSEFGVLEP